MKYAIIMLLMCAVVVYATVFTGQYVECREIPGDTEQICYYDSTIFGILSGDMNRLDTIVRKTREIDSTTIYYGDEYRYIILGMDTAAGNYLLWDEFYASTSTMTINDMGHVDVYSGLKHWHLMTYVSENFRKNKVFYSNWHDYYMAWHKRVFEKE